MGQIYIPVINWFLMIMCVVVVASFQSTTDIANAYGNVSYISENIPNFLGSSELYTNFPVNLHSPVVLESLNGSRITAKLIFSVSCNAFLPLNQFLIFQILLKILDDILFIDIVSDLLS